MPNHSYENEFDLEDPTGSFSCKSNSFSYERFCTKTCSETEGNSKMAY